MAEPSAPETGGDQKRARSDSARLGYVRVRGLPYSATAENLREFFAPAGIRLTDEDVVLRYNASGEAFIRAPIELVPAALALNKGTLGRRYLEIFAAEEADFERVVSSTAPDGAKVLVRMRGLPWGASKEDIEAFFAPQALTAVHIMSRHDGRQTGDAYVELESEAAVAEAMGRNRAEMSGRYIELFPATKGEMLAVSAAHTDPGGGAADAEGGCVVRVRGLPWAASAADVAHFFAGLPIEGGEGGVVLPLGDDGRMSGEALVPFETAEAAQAALRKDKAVLAQRWVAVTRATRAELRAASAASVAAGGPGGARAYAYASPEYARARPLELPPHLVASLHPAMSVCVRVRGAPPAATEAAVAEHFAGGGAGGGGGEAAQQAGTVVPAAVRVVLKHGQPSGCVYALFESEHACETALSRAAQPLLGTSVELFKCSLREMLHVCNRPQGAAAQQGGTGGAGGAEGGGAGAAGPAVPAAAAASAPGGYAAPVVASYATVALHGAVPAHGAAGVLSAALPPGVAMPAGAQVAPACAQQPQAAPHPMPNGCAAAAGAHGTPNGHLPPAAAAVLPAAAQQPAHAAAGAAPEYAAAAMPVLSAARYPPQPACAAHPACAAVAQAAAAPHATAATPSFPPLPAVSALPPAGAAAVSAHPVPPGPSG